MLTDYHCHVLPGMDDGAQTTEVSLQMIEMLRRQGVERIVATPHFYAHRESSVDSFLAKRKNSAETVFCQNPSVSQIRLGAEVAIEQGISEVPGIEKLAIEGTSCILLEFPYTKYAEWMCEEVYNISFEFGLTPIIAHIHRYDGFFSKTAMENILQMHAVFQINNEVFSDWRARRFVKHLIKSELPLIFGSDSHDLTSRKPNFDLLLKSVDERLILQSNEFLEHV